MNIIDLRYLDWRRDDLAETVARTLWHIGNDGESFVDKCRDLIRAKGDPSKDLDEAETFARTFLLAVLLLKLEFDRSKQ